MSCKCAIPTDQYHGWECTVSGGECMFLMPNSKACAEKYCEGPDAKIIEERRSGMSKVSSNDVILVCKVCSTEFVISQELLDKFAAKKLSAPTHCPACLEKKHNIKYYPCKDCGGQFGMNQLEREYYLEKMGWPLPVRCPKCREKRRVAKEATRK